MAHDTVDAIIIGAGVIGCSTALALSRQGLRTLNIDRLPAAGYGSTSHSAAIIRPYYSTIEGTALAYEGHFYWQRWTDFLRASADSPLAVYHQCGCLVLMSTENGQLVSTCKTLDAVGVPYQRLNPDEVRARLPIATMDSFAPPKRTDDPAFGHPNAASLQGAIFCPTGGYISDPQLATRNLQDAAMALGARFRFNTDVVAIRRQSGRIVGVTLADGTLIDAPIVVNIAGPHSMKVNALLGDDHASSIATRALRQEVAHVPAPPGFDFERKGSVLTDADTGTYLRPEVGNHMLIGGLEPKCDTLEWVDPDNHDPAFSEQWTTHVWRTAQRFPTLGVPNQAQGFVALYDVSDDWIPIYDRGDIDGYFTAIGTSGNQFKNAPIVGEMMAKLITSCMNGHDHDADPLTYHLTHLDRDISLKFFSRKRPINRDSSFSVLA